MKLKAHQYEVIIVGAGAAGLACARKLRENGTDFLLLEARSRVGGRAHSATLLQQTAPIEFGAEFIHGAPKATLDILEQLNVGFYDVDDSHFYLQENELKIMPGYSDKLEKVMNAAKAKKKDMTISDFLAGYKSKDIIGKALFKSYVEGFQGADLTVTGTAALSDAERSEKEGSINKSELFRPVESYQSIFERVFHSIKTEDNARFDTVVKNIKWSAHNVKLTCATGPLREQTIYRCKKLVLTVPIGVLKSDQIEWSPKPQALDKILDHLHMGHIQRITFCFRTRFWEKLTEKPLTFFHLGTDHFFPTWWTYQPIRAPYLVAWQGGPKGKEMSTWAEEKILDAALETLSVATRLSKKDLNAQLVSWHTHNWSRDPHSLGAYSYIGQGGLALAKKLATPIENTIYFAGEGTMMGSARGTVHGALISGAHVAQLILK